MSIGTENPEQPTQAMTIAQVRTLRLAGKTREAAIAIGGLKDQEQPDVLSERFYIAFELGDTAEAERTGTAICAQQPMRDIEILSHLGLLFRRKGRLAEALEAFSTARQVASRTSVAVPEWFFGELSGIYHDQQKWDLAREAAEAGIDVKPVLGLTIASALLHQGQIDAARDRLDETIGRLADDPTRADRVAAACRQLLAIDPSSRSRRVVAQAVAAYPDSPAFAEFSAENAALSENWPEAAERFEKLLEAPGALSSALPLRLLPQLTALARQVPGGYDRFNSFFERAILAQPNSDAILFQWQDFLATARPDLDVATRFIEIQENNPTLMPALVIELAKRIPLQELHDRFERQIEIWQRSSAFAACRAMLDAICGFRAVERGVVERVATMPHNMVRLFFLFRQPNLRVVQLRMATPHEETLLREVGVDVDRVAAFLDDFTDIGLPEWSAYLEAASFASDEVRALVRRDEAFVGFQDRIVRDKTFGMIDPLTGEIADLFDSVKIFDRQVFAFRGSELFVFISGGNMNSALFIYLIGANIQLGLSSPDKPAPLGYFGSAAYMCELMAVYLQRVAHNHKAFERSAAEAPAMRDKAKRIIVIQGRAENPAHHIWNYLPPFERLSLANLIGNIDLVIPPPTIYYGEAAELYPELAGTPTQNCPELAAIDPCPFSPDAIAVQLGGNFIPRALIDRIRRWAASKLEAARAAAIEREARHFPIIWISLRVNDKSWRQQDDGVARIIDIVRSSFPEARFLLDGFSLPVGSTSVPAKWNGAVIALRALVERISAKTSHPEAVIDLIGNSLAESIVWAERTDVYFAPLGSSQHKVGWVSAARGIVYTSPSLADTPAWRRPGAWESEGAPVPRFLIAGTFGPGRRRGPHDYRANLDNVDFEPETAAEMILQAVVTGRR